MGEMWTSGSSLSETDLIAAQLAPPPDVFFGSEQAFWVSRGMAGDAVSGHLEFRRAQASILGQDDELHVLVVVEPNASDRSNLVAAGELNRLDASDLHDALKLMSKEMFSIGECAVLIGTSAYSQRIRRQVQELQRTQGDVLIVGPVGSGRRRLAEVLQYANDVVGEKCLTTADLLIPVHADTCDPDTVQTTIRSLFADDGGAALPTMLLLEADRLSVASQIELREFFSLLNKRFRVLATAQQSLLDLARTSDFDLELAMRLSTFVVEIPPLSKRREDIPLLLQFVIEQSNATGRRQLSGVNKSAIHLLTDYHWPGELAELEQVIAEACLKSSGPNIIRADLPLRLVQAESAREHPVKPIEKIELTSFLIEIEKQIIERALQQAKGNKTQAASLLGISRGSLLRRLSQLGINDE